MSWYSTGSVAVSNGSATIIGTGTSWVRNVRSGDAFKGPDNVIYEVDEIVSDTEIALATAYGGATTSGAAYRVVPTTSHDKELVEGITTILGTSGRQATFYASRAAFESAQPDIDPKIGALASAEETLFEYDAVSSILPNLPGWKISKARHYKTVSALMASQEPSRGTGSVWEAGGFRYKEVSSEETHTTAAGVKLLLLQEGAFDRTNHIGQQPISSVTDLETRLAGVESVASSGMSPKAAAACATTANITLSGEQTIDGVLTAASRVLVKNQTTTAQNGLYVSGAGAWTRATDMDAAGEFAKASVYVDGGTTNGGRTYYQTGTVATVGTDAVTWLKAAGQSPLQAKANDTADRVDALEAQVTDSVVLGDGEPVAFAIADPDTGQAAFQVLADARGSIVNPHFQTVEADATEAMQGRQAYPPNESGLAWGVAQDKADGSKAVLLGVRSNDGRILNPSFDALWDAVFGGEVSTGSLSEADSIILHGPRIYAVEGRAIDLFGPSLLPNRNSGFGYYFALQSVAANGQPLQSLWREQTRIRCDDLGTSARLKLVNDGIAATEFSKSLTVVKSAAAKVATPRVALIGDSLTAGSYLEIADRFAGYSVTPTLIGTRRTDANRDVWAEGRGGWGAIDYCYDRMDFAPLPSGSEATALANGTDNRNPFIRASTGGDDPDKVRNGYIFDYRYYLDRFAMADPDIVVINLGTNDINNLDWPTGYPRARDCIDIMVAQIRAACPNAIIGLAQTNKGNNSYFNPRWYNGWAPLFLHHHETYGASSDVHVLSSHASMFDRLTYPMATSSTNAQTGQTKQVLSDGTHPDSFVGYDAYAESIFSFIHAVS